MYAALEAPPKRILMHRLLARQLRRVTSYHQHHIEKQRDFTVFSVHTFELLCYCTSHIDVVALLQGAVEASQKLMEHRGVVVSRVRVRHCHESRISAEDADND
jgi:hypothetical protein